MLDLSPGKLLVIAVIALFLIGPDKLPEYATRLAQWVRVARSMLDEAKGRITAELGPEFEDVDWASLDPRRYHPRRLVAEAWNTAAPSARSAAPVVETDEPDLLAVADARAAASAPVRTATAPYDLAG